MAACHITTYQPASASDTPSALLGSVVLPSGRKDPASPQNHLARDQPPSASCAPGSPGQLLRKDGRKSAVALGVGHGSLRIVLASQFERRWCATATAKLHNAPLHSVAASQSQAPFVAATAGAPCG
ncbi:MAG: hypothetical protein COW02_09005 [Comamonadaceae bacterium CG12_big_fil_rev_8_21_14_0_65_59_15]|nr:MAG: hypothetical protein COW02_09005 [Comamonadaceae bacterium CG12_big_fil_rev_8_21_14_0_65_59_15]